jgi:O-antigen/teichoic acid export membrane protein
MNRSFGRGALPLFSAAIADQVLLSGTNFVVGFLIIRYATDHDYAMYVLVQSAILLGVTLHNSWLTGPLAILTPRMGPDERWRTIGSVMQVQRRILRLIALPLLLLPLAGYLWGVLSGLLALVTAIGILAGWASLRREYLRSVLLIYSRTQSLLGADSVFAGALLLGILVTLLTIKPAIIGASLALMLAFMAGAAAGHRSLAITPGWKEPGEVTIWPRIRGLGFWALIGASTYWFLGQSFNFVLAHRIDLRAVADINAARLMLMPAMVLTVGLTSLLTPSAVQWYVEIGLQGLVRRLLKFLLVVGCLQVLYFICVWSIRDWLFADVLHKTIQDRERLLLLWAALALVALLREVVQCALIAMGRYKSLAWQVGIGTAVAMPLMWFGIAWWGLAAALIGQIVGELIYLAGIALSLRMAMKRDASRSSGPLMREI